MDEDGVLYVIESRYPGKTFWEPTIFSYFDQGRAANKLTELMNEGWEPDIDECVPHYRIEMYSRAKPKDKYDSVDDRRTENNVARHEYRTLTENEKIDVKNIKDAGAEFIRCLDTVASHYPHGYSDELSTARMKVREAMFWGVSHVTKD